jgi:hypothetical protein
MAMQLGMLVPRRSDAAAIAIVALAGGVLMGALFAACRQAGDASRFVPSRQARTVRAAAQSGHDLRVFVEQGHPSEARVYAGHIERAIGFPADGSLDRLLAFCGYPHVTGRELETLTPDALSARLTGRVLATRFFAPHIVDVSSIGGPASAKELGWRKVVRLVVDATSPAGVSGMRSLFVMFSAFQPRREIAGDPFAPCTSMAERCSPHVQAILVPRQVETGADAVFFLAFENAAAGGRRADHLDASFDGGDHASTRVGAATKPYYLPAACTQCHGGSAAEGKLIYLDSDHWFDRTRAGDDFADLDVDSPNAVLFDGGRDTTTTRFAAAFAVIAALNREIRDQNAAAGGEDFGLRAVEHWLDLHETNNAFADLVARGLPAPVSNPAARRWQDTSADRALLGALNRYCFRCHSTVAYHVFDKEAVYERRRAMARRLELGRLRPGGMPQDRTLDVTLIQDLARRLRAIQ